MEINRDIYRRAKNITEKRNELQKYIDICLEARICPKCGEEGLEKYEYDKGFMKGVDYECPHCDWGLLL